MAKKKGKLHGAWRILESPTKYKNQYGLEVVEHQVVRPDGNYGIYGVVNIGKGVLVLPVDNEHNVYMGEHFAFASGENVFDVISGGIRAGEMPEAAARRELKEETGISAMMLDYLGYAHPICDIVCTEQHFFLARELSFGEKEQEGTEKIKLIKIPLEEAVKKAYDNSIVDPLSAFLILKVEYYLRNN